MNPSASCSKPDEMFGTRIVAPSPISGTDFATPVPPLRVCTSVPSGCGVLTNSEAGPVFKKSNTAGEMHQWRKSALIAGQKIFHEMRGPISSRWV